MEAQRKTSVGERVYFAAVIVTGSAVAIWSTAQLYLNDISREWLVLAGLTLLTGSFTLKVPSVLARISVSDAFVFASVLLYGPSAATAIVAIDSLVATFWMRPEHRSALRSIFNLSVVSIAVWSASHLFIAVAAVSSGSRDLVLTQLVWPLFVLAAAYFLFNSGLIAIALSFELRANPIKVWWLHFPWFSLNYFAGVSAAALLVSYTRTIDLSAIGIILPLLIIPYLTYRSSLGRLEDATKHVDQVNSLYMATIEALTMAVDAKDQITHGHIRRVQVFTVELAKRLGVHDAHQLQAITAAALLHDMGKLAIPEHILNKPGKLTAAEFENMKRHAAIGADLLSSVQFPYPVVPIVRHHHEHWDGGGYPSGISGTDIPLGARILSVVDCFDALTSDRPYRPRVSLADAFHVLRERRGTVYDPLVVDAFIANHAEIAPLATKAGEEAKSLISEGRAIPDDTLALRQIRASASESTRLAEFERSLGDRSTLAIAFELAAQTIRELTPATVVTFYRHVPATESLNCELVFGDSENRVHGLTIRVGERVTGWSAANGRTSINSHAALDLGLIAETMSPPPLSTISTPLSAKNTLLGVLTAYASRSDAFRQEHQYVFEHVAATLSHRCFGITRESGNKLVSFSRPSKHQP